MTAINPIRRKFDAGETVTAFVVTTPSVALAQLFAASGVDCLIFDLEHGTADLATVHAMVAATNGTGATPLVRIPAIDLGLAKPVLETGAFGLVFPMVNSAEDARLAVRAIRYPPEGERGLAPGHASARWGVPFAEYVARANRELLNVVLIEHPQAVANLDEILAVPGIDVAVVATFDLSMALGVPGRRDHPEVRRLADAAERKILDAGVVLGGPALSVDEANAMIGRGFRFVALGYDVPMIQGAAARALAGLIR